MSPTKRLNRQEFICFQESAGKSGVDYLAIIVVICIVDGAVRICTVTSATLV